MSGIIMTKTTLWRCVALSVLMVAAPRAQAVLITNVTQGTILFDSRGFENDAAGGAPSAANPGTWTLVSGPPQIQTTDAGAPGAYEGRRYAASYRDSASSDAMLAYFNAPQSTPGDHIRMEWMWWLPANADARVYMGHNEGGTFRNLLRVTGGNVLSYDPNASSYAHLSSNLTYTPETWQKWTLDYVVGETSFSLQIGDGPAATGNTLKSLSTAGGGSINHLALGHNALNATWYLDAATSTSSGAYEPQPQDSLKQMIDISWRLGPRTPKGQQTSAAGILHNTLITVGGFNNGSGPGGRGFHHEAWGLAIGNENGQWQELPSFPGSNDPNNVDGAGRQSLFSTVVGDALYMWGGFNYTAPFTYADGYKLSRSGSQWVWTPLPSLPTPRLGAGLVAVGHRIYAVGGGDYNREHFFTLTDRTGTQEAYGARMYVFDTQAEGDGWTELPPLPGTPRMYHATAAVCDKIYVIGGVGRVGPSNGTVVDNWVFDTATQTWSRIRDLPVASGNFPGGAIVVEDRYILLIGGYQYSFISQPDGTKRPVYGTPSKTIEDHPFYSDVWVYDTYTNQFGTATPLPMNNNMPTVVIKDGVLHLIGGETLGFEVFGETFEHHPDLYLIGNITVIPEPASAGSLMGLGSITMLRRR